MGGVWNTPNIAEECVSKGVKDGHWSAKSSQIAIYGQKLGGSWKLDLLGVICEQPLHPPLHLKPKGCCQITAQDPGQSLTLFCKSSYFVLVAEFSVYRFENKSQSRLQSDMNLFTCPPTHLPYPYLRHKYEQINFLLFQSVIYIIIFWKHE